MTNPLTLLVNLQTYNGIPPTNNPDDSITFNQKTQESSVSEASRLKKTVPNATTDMVLNLIDSSTDYLLMSVDQQVSIKVNGSATALTLKPQTAGARTPVFLIRGTITSLTISNSSGAIANVDFISVKI